MAVGWFLAPMVRATTGLPGQPVRASIIWEHRADLRTAGAAMSETEVLGNRWITKVRGSEAVLSAVAALPGVRRLPTERLDDPLSSLSSNQRDALRQELTDAGYSVDEVTARFPNIANHTLREVLMFLATRRKRARYDKQADAFLLDGPDQPCRSIRAVDEKV